MTTEPEQNLSRYVPQYVLRKLAQDPQPMVKPAMEQFPAAVLFADISGFTPLTEQLMAQGEEGAEKLTGYLNSYFGEIIQQVHEHGGDVMKFAGDALVAVWPAGEEGLTNPARLAAQCGLDIQRRLMSFSVEDGDVRLSLRLNLASGKISVMYLGGVLERWETLITGAPFSKILELRPHTRPDDVVVCHSAWEEISDAFRGDEVGDGAARLKSVRERLVPTISTVPAPGPMAEAALRSMIPGVVLSRISAGQSGWLGELRRVAMMFVGLPALEQGDPDPLDRMQSVVSAIQESVYRFDGSINKIAVDEKGAVLVTAFGLPPLSHEDDPSRAVKSALLMQRELARVGLRASVGISTGRVFCGPVGDERRSEYTMIGDTVNLAARLMATAEGRILCDQQTCRSAERELVFEHLKQVSLKGLSSATRVFRPTGETKLTLRSKIALVGRTEERALISERLQALVRTKTAGTLVVEGEAGIGKSRLVDEVVHQARTLGVFTYVGAGDAVEDSTPYFAWRPVFTQLFRLHNVSDPVGFANYVLEQLQDDDELVRLAPLLNVVLPIDLEDNEHTEQMHGEVRANNTHSLLARLLERASAEQPILMVVEDAHWIDSASWAVAKAMSRDVPSVMVLIATRPLSESVPVEYSEILALEETDKITLGGLSSDDTATLIRQRLGVVALPEVVTNVVYKRAEGNPLFTEELAYVLRDTGRIIIDGEECRLSIPPEEFSQAKLPDTIEGVVTSRLDRLDANQQLVLKVASVIGRAFPVRVVRDVFPLTEQRDTVPKLLEPLVKLDVLRPEEETLESFIFKHVLMKEAVYNLMLFSQRRELHRSVAEWHEQNELPGERSKNYELLAHHWQSAEEYPRAANYLEKAGAQALDSYANQETVTFYNQALSLNKRHNLELPQDRTGSWRRDLAEAQFRLGNLDACRQHGQVALTALNRALPSSTIGTVISLWKQIFVRALQRWFPAAFAVKDEAERQLRIAATRVQNRLTEVFIYQEDALRCLDSGLREINTAEPAGKSPELGRAYAVLAVVLGTVPLHGVCRTWSRRAVQVTEASGNPGALAYVLSRVAVYDLYVAHWEVGSERLRRAVEIARSLGDRRLREEAMAILAKTLFYSSRFSESRRLWEEVAVSSQYSASEQTYTWSLFGRAENLLRMGSASAAMPLLDESMGWVASKAQASEELWMYGLLSLAHVRTGEPDKARAIADRIMPLVSARPVAYWTQQSAAAVAEVLLWLQEEGHSEVSKPAAAAVKGCESFAKVFPFGKAQALLWRGLHQRIAGAQGKAMATWEKCIEASERIGTPYERGRAYLEMGRSLPAGDNSRKHYLNQCIHILEPLGAVWEIQKARRYLEPG